MGSQWVPGGQRAAWPRPLVQRFSIGMDNTNEALPGFCSNQILVLCCGNLLFGDDGFGPAVAAHLQAHREIPEGVYLMDVGTGVRKLLFTLCLSPERPQRIVLVDAVDVGRAPGEIFEIDLDAMPAQKCDDFYIHGVPSSNMAQELRSAGVDVRVLVCQVNGIPASVQPGLSEPVASAVPRMCEWILAEHLAGEGRKMVGITEAAYRTED